MLVADAGADCHCICMDTTVYGCVFVSVPARGRREGAQAVWSDGGRA
jgi:hypothetical protein